MELASHPVDGRILRVRWSAATSRDRRAVLSSRYGGIRRLARSSASLLLAFALATVVGCAAAPPVAAGAKPDQLTVDVSVLAGRSPEPAPTVDRRTGRYILFPDGSLHADVGPTLRPDVRPGLTRRLRDSEVEQVWRAIVDGGLDDPSAFAAPTNDALLAPPRGVVAHLVTIEADGRRWQVIRTVAIDAEADPITTALVRQLAALAWEPDVPTDALVPGGIRYDFGPDPYATFRAVGIDPPLAGRGGAHGGGP